MRICLTIKAPYIGFHFLYIHKIYWTIQIYYCKEKLQAGHSWGLDG